MAKQSRIMPVLGLVLLIVGVLALVFKSVPAMRMQDLVSATFFIMCALYFVTQAMHREDAWWMVLPAGICFTVATILIVRNFNLATASLQWVIFFAGSSLTFHLLWKNRPHAGRDGWLRGLSYLLAALALFQYARTIHLLDSLTLAALILLAGGAWFILRKK